MTSVGKIASSPGAHLTEQARPKEDPGEVSPRTRGRPVLAIAHPDELGRDDHGCEEEAALHGATRRCKHGLSQSAVAPASAPDTPRATTVWSSATRCRR